MTRRRDPGSQRAPLGRVAARGPRRPRAPRRARWCFGLFLAAHGYNKVFGGGGLAGTARWFGSIGMRWPDVQARLAAGTEIGRRHPVRRRAADAARRGRDDRRDDGRQLRRPPRQLLRVQGRLGVHGRRSPSAAWAVAAIGPGDASLDHAIGLDWTAWDGWIGAVIAGVVGVGGAVAQLAVCYRPQPTGRRRRRRDGDRGAADRRPTDAPFRPSPWRYVVLGHRRAVRGVLDLGPVLRLQGVDQRDRRGRLDRPGPGDLRGRRRRAPGPRRLPRGRRRRPGDARRARRHRRPGHRHPRADARRRRRRAADRRQGRRARPAVGGRLPHVPRRPPRRSATTCAPGATSRSPRRSSTASRSARRSTRFAADNRMPACAPPTDLG